MKYLILALAFVSFNSYATTMLLRSEHTEGEWRYCVYSSSSESEQIVIKQKAYIACKRVMS